MILTKEKLTTNEVPGTHLEMHHIGTLAVPCAWSSYHVLRSQQPTSPFNIYILDSISLHERVKISNKENWNVNFLGFALRDVPSSVLCVELWVESNRLPVTFETPQNNSQYITDDTVSYVERRRVPFDSVPNQPLQMIRISRYIG